MRLLLERAESHCGELVFRPLLLQAQQGGAHIRTAGNAVNDHACCHRSLLSSGCTGIGILDKIVLEDGAPAALVALAQACRRVTELFPARMRQLDPGAALFCREADLDQLILPGLELDDPGKGEAMRRVVGQHGPPWRLAPV